VRCCRLPGAVLLALAICVQAAAAQAPDASPTDVTVRTHVDRTAMWVADRIIYTIEMTCRRGVDVLADDLSRDKLKLDGLDMIGSETERVSGSDDSTRYVFRYTLTTHRVDLPALKVEPLSVRYYVKRPGQRLDDAAPAGTVQVPGAVVAFRSLLPDDQPSYEVRDDRPAAARPPAYRVLAPVGIGLIILSVAPVALLALGMANRARLRRHSHAARSRRQARHDARALLEAVRAADPTREEDRRDAFNRLDDLVRAHVIDVSGVPARSLTPAEVAAALTTGGSRMEPALVSSVLTTCELARYAPPDRLPPLEGWRETLARAEEILAATR